MVKSAGPESYLKNPKKDRNKMDVMTKTVWLGILLFACLGFLSARPLMLDKPVTVMDATELKIERGDCLVYSKPLYCMFPGNGYRIEVQNGTRRGGTPVRSYSVSLGGSWDVLSGPQRDDPAGKKEASVYLDGRSFLRVTLRGAPGDGIVMRIYCEAGQVDLHRQVIYGAASLQQARSMPAARASASQPLSRTPAVAAKPLPAVSLKSDREAIRIGEAIRIDWDAENAASARFTAGDLGQVGCSGSALVWPEKDTLYRIEAMGGGNAAVAEFTARVAVPDPELELDVEPKTVMEGQEVTMTWRTKNARLVRFGDQGHEMLPLSGKKSFKPNRNTRFSPLALIAENGEKKTRKTIVVNVLDPEVEKQRIEREKASRTIPPEIDKTLRGTWDELQAALLAGDAEKAASCFCPETRDKYLETYKALKEKLPQIGAEMREIEFVSSEEGGAKYRTKRKEVIQGKEYDISYDVYFIIDQDGQWRIYRF
jgi:hypothetical protein